MTPKPLSIDTSQTEQFLESLEGPGWKTSVFVWQTFDDNKLRKKTLSEESKRAGVGSGRDVLAKVICATWTDTQKKLITLNLNGAGIYIAGNRCVSGRKIENLVGFRAVWMDWDNPDKSPPEDEDWPLIPHIKVQTSPGKFQFWWRVKDLDSTSHWRLNHALAMMYDGDKRAIDAVHVLRVPGFYHQKGEPTLSTLEYSEPWDGGGYSVAEMLSKFGVEEWEGKRAQAEREQKEVKKASSKSSGRSLPKIPLEVEKARSALGFLSADDRDLWLKIGMSLASTGQSQAFSIWDEWSQTSDKYDENDQYRVWQSLREQKGVDHANPITLGTLFKTARESGWIHVSEDWEALLLRNKDGEIRDCPANLIRILSNHSDWNGRINLNKLSCITEIDEHPITEKSIADVSVWLATTVKVGVRNLGHIFEAINAVGSDHSYHPIIEMLEELPECDGINRLDSMFADFLGAEQSPYTAFVGRALLCSMIARAYEPGCIIRFVPILEGKEGIGKSRFVRDLGHPWSREVSTNVENRQAIAEVISGVWLAEMMEMDALSKAAASRIKAFITTTNDRRRLPYGHVPLDFPRTTVFVGTTNPNEAAAQFREEDENTRFFPVVVTEYNHDAFIAARDMLFAEAKIYLKEHPDTWWIPPHAATQSAVELREERTAQDPWIGIISEYCMLPDREELRMREVLELLEIPIERWTRQATTRIGVILKRIGWFPYRQESTDMGRVRVYKRLVVRGKR